MKFKFARILATALGLSAAGTMAATADDYPSRPIQVIVGFSAGGAMDATIRTLAPTMEKILGQPVVIVNKPGAGGALAWTQVAQAKPDGYTLGSLNYPAIAGVTASGGLPMDPLKSFAFLGNVINDPAVVVVPADSPYKSLTDVIDYLKSNPSGLSYGATGSTSLDGLTALALSAKAGAKFRVVNFEGTPEAVTAALGHHIDALGMAASEVGPFLKDGSLRVLGVGGSERDSRLPDIPTFKEQGIDLPIKSSSRGLIAPAGVSEDILNKLRDAIKQATGDAEYKDRASKAGLFVSYSSADDVRGAVTEQIDFLKDSLPK